MPDFNSRKAERREDHRYLKMFEYVKEKINVEKEVLVFYFYFKKNHWLPILLVVNLPASPQTPSSLSLFFTLC